MAKFMSFSPVIRKGSCYLFRFKSKYLYQMKGDIKEYPLTLKQDVCLITPCFKYAKMPA